MGSVSLCSRNPLGPIPLTSWVQPLIRCLDVLPIFSMLSSGAPFVLIFQRFGL